MYAYVRFFFFFLKSKFRSARVRVSRVISQRFFSPLFSLYFFTVIFAANGSPPPSPRAIDRPAAQTRPSHYTNTVRTRAIKPFCGAGSDKQVMGFPKPRARAHGGDFILYREISPGGTASSSSSSFKTKTVFAAHTRTVHPSDGVNA